MTTSSPTPDDNPTPYSRRALLLAFAAAMGGGVASGCSGTSRTSSSWQIPTGSGTGTISYQLGAGWTSSPQHVPFNGKIAGLKLSGSQNIAEESLVPSSFSGAFGGVPFDLQFEYIGALELKGTFSSQWQVYGTIGPDAAVATITDTTPRYVTLSSSYIFSGRVGSHAVKGSANAAGLLITAHFTID